MAHTVPTMIGVGQRDIARKIGNLVPDYMVMGDKGMADMGTMEMPLPDNTLRMTSGEGPYGSIEMGGMFTVVKLRDGLARGDYRGPGWYRQPRDTQAYEWTGFPLAEAPAPPGQATTPDPRQPNLKVIRGSHHDSH